ncbi:hypothetical protein, partial [Acetobacter pasteurianus]|uniref:hypothetical protein n=1 Tax=Acetobacter pasteurianus TaxID=438 RepID=UPI001BE072BF
HSSSHHTKEGITERDLKPEGFSNPPSAKVAKIRYQELQSIVLRFLYIKYSRVKHVFTDRKNNFI